MPKWAGHCGSRAGRNRLQAAIELKWNAIDALEVSDRDLGEDATTAAKLTEIAENLHRRELDELERAELVAAWVALVQERRRSALQAQEAARAA